MNRDEELKKEIKELYKTVMNDRDAEWYYTDERLRAELLGRNEMKKEIMKIIEEWNCQKNPVIERTMNTLMRRIK
jgi:hypothetical protein